jgi:hypothetical protein
MRIKFRVLSGLLVSLLCVSTVIAGTVDIPAFKSVSGPEPDSRTAAIVKVGPLPDPSGRRVALRGSALATAGAVLAGRGIEGIEAQPFIDYAGRELIWKEVRRHVDPEGNIHAFYRQHLIGNGIDAEVYGSEVGAHYSPDGVLRSVSGTHYREVNVANGVSLDPEGAVEAATFRLMAHNQVRVRPFAEISADLRERSVKAAKLMLVERDGMFRYHYFAVVSDVDDAGYQVVLDADTEAIVAVTETNPANNCVPTAPVSAVAATGTPVRTGPAPRSLKANPAADKPAPFTHEGYWTATPSKVVYQQITGSALWMCDSSPEVAHSWTIFPVRTENGVPVYKDWADQTTWRGSVAGDALHHANLTMAAFNSMGRHGWNGNYGEARIIIESVGANYDQARFNNNYTSAAPLNAVMLGRSRRMYPAASSLDWVAHEFGHGVVNTSAGFPYSGVGAELDEGFADVIGHLVEKRSHPTGNGLEKSSDWTMHEDAAVSGYARGAIDDGASHTWVGPTTYNGTNYYTFNDLLHKDDTPTLLANTHSRANKMSVVHRLLAEGGKNPVCSRLPGLSGCETTVTALGLSKANKILFNALQFYIASSATWDDLADTIAETAFNEYDKCSLDPIWNAAVEQQAVFDAFKAIGHPGSGVLNECF